MTIGYNNPYKFNGKELDMATGYYYYGARYYDPKRSFWLSVDPLSEITNSPYAYVWNDPVNFADPTGLMGERVGGGNPGDPPGKRSFLRRAYDWIFGRKSHGNVTVGLITSSLEPDLPWYLNKGEYGGKPVLTLGAHNIKFPYIQREEYNSNVLENGDRFMKNAFGSAYNGLASMWNEGMAGKEGSAIVFEGDRDVESAVRRIVRGKAGAEEFEGLAAMAIIHKVGKPVGGLASEKSLVRFGQEAETLESLARQAQAAEDAGFPHGVSTMLKDKVKGSDLSHKSALKSTVESFFEVEQTGNKLSIIR